MATRCLLVSDEGGNDNLKGADMGKVTKTVIEDIAYQLLTIISMCATIYMLA